MPPCLIGMEACVGARLPAARVDVAQIAGKDSSQWRKETNSQDSIAQTRSTQ